MVRSSRRLRAALIGAGRRGLAHAQTLASLPDFYELVALCDLDAGRAREVAAQFGARAYADPAALLASEEIEAVVIATPPDTHHVVAKAAADARVHMLIETPLALTRAMMDFIGEAAERAGVKVEVGENYGRRPGEVVVHQAVAAGLIGRLNHLAYFNAPMNHESCYHAVSLLGLYAGAEVEEVEAIAHSHPVLGDWAGAEAETWVDSVWRFGNGVTASCYCLSSWASPLRAGRPRVVTLEGTLGYIAGGEDFQPRLRRLEGAAPVEYPLKIERHVLSGQEVPRRYAFETTPRVEFENPFADRILADVAYGPGDSVARATELVALYRAVLEGLPPVASIAAARRSQEVSIAILEAARVKRPLLARLSAETDWEREQHQAFRRQWGVDPIKGVPQLLGHWAAGGP